MTHHSPTPPQPDRPARDWINMTFRTMLSTAESGGTISITEVVSTPKSGPPRHIHHDADEVFVLLTGEMKVWLDGETFHRGAGDVVFIPKGAEHAFRIVSDHPCRHLVIFTPGGFETFFEEMATKGTRIPEDMEAVVECGTRHHLTFTGPPIDL